MKFQLTITMLSDWHIGAGAGRRGDIDRLVQRDTDGLPYLPAKTLTGIWRDACELIADGLDSDGSASTSWKQWVDFLFGDQPAIAPSPASTAPQPAALSIRAAHLPTRIKDLLQHRARHHKPAHQALQSAFTFIKPGISIDDKGCAKEDFLRFEEMARIGTVLTADCELLAALNQDQQQAACTLLAAGAKVVERLGGKRRRGAGRCKFKIDWPKESELLQNSWQVLEQDAPPLPQMVFESDAEPLATRSAETEWQRITIALEALTPLVIPARTIGNVVETLDYIPGTYLLRLVLQQLQSLGVDLSNAMVQGDLLVTNATIAIAKQPGQPIPACLFYEKSGGGLDKGGKVYNRLCEPEPDSQLKGYRSGYVEFTKSLETLPAYQTVDTLVGTHNTIQDKYQRPTSEVGGVYSYEAIAPKTRFQAELRMRQSIYEALCQKQADWYEKLQGHHCIGQSKKDDYGAVEITVKVIQPERKTDTSTEDSKQTEQTEQTEQTKKLWVWLLSDVLLRNESLRPTASVEDFRQALQQTLNAEGDDSIQLTLSTPGEGLISAMLRSHRVESWQRRWNLPRPSLVGIAAGSCMVFEVTGTLDLQRLRQLELSGIGERTAEGYGQLCFNHPLLSKPLSAKKPNPKIEKDLESENAKLNPPLLSASGRNSDVFRYARLIEKAAWREAIRRAALFLASKGDRREARLGIRIQNNERGEPVSQPSMSQLGGLRSVISQLKFNQKDPVLSWLQNIRDKRSNKWDGTQDGLGKIECLINEEEQIWEWISTALCHTDPNQNSLNYPSLQELTLTETGESDLKQELWTEAIQVVIDACIRGHKRELEELEKKHEQAGVATGANHGA
ncbi:MAG: RAMP superfamily CRISPR-associated protein [Cyanobacteriota bacterium]